MPHSDITNYCFGLFIAKLLTNHSPELNLPVFIFNTSGGKRMKYRQRNMNKNVM